MGEMETMACDARHKANWQATFLSNEMRGENLGRGNPGKLTGKQVRANRYTLKCIFIPPLHLTSGSMVNIVALDFPTSSPP